MKSVSLILLISFVVQIILFILIIEYFSNSSMYIKITPTDSNFDFSFGYSISEMFESYILANGVIGKIETILKTGGFWIIVILTFVFLNIFWFLTKYIYKMVKN